MTPAAVFAVLGASLLGSVHCGAMCGAFACTYAAPWGGGSGLRASHAAYHAGRLVSYALLGAMAGLAGRGADQLGILAGLSRGAALVGGGLMVAWALSQIGAVTGTRATRSVHGAPSARSAHRVAARVPEWSARMLGAILLRARDASPVRRAALTGLITTLLPCGWLYAFVATAAASGSAWSGVLVMTTFWAGTVPMLLAVAVGARRALGPLARRLPLASAAVVLVLGLMTIAGRFGRPDPAHAMPVNSAAATHAH